MSTHQKKLLQTAFEALAEGDPTPFLDLLTDDVVWTVTGTTALSGVYRGKAALHADLLGPVFAKFATQYRSVPSRFIAEDDIVVVETRGDVMTTSGERYDNNYCYVCRFDGDRIVEVTEYLDTDLVRRVLC